MTDKPPKPPWRQPPFTTIHNPYLVALTSSELSRHALAAMFFILTQTWGSSGRQRGHYGRWKAPVPLATIAAGIGRSSRTAGRAVAELEAAGWITRAKDGRGRRGCTVRPATEPPLTLKFAPEQPCASEAAPPLPAEAALLGQWARDKRAERAHEAVRNSLGGAA